MSGKNVAVHRNCSWATDNARTLAVNLAHTVICLYLKNVLVNNFFAKKTKAPVNKRGLS